MEKNELFAVLRKMNVIQAIVEFSGGNDEGGVDWITLYHQNGAETELPTWVESQRWNPTTNSYENIELTDEQKLTSALSEAVYDRYGSFAGEFSVSGTITYDVLTEKISMKKSESYTEWRDSEEDL